MTESCENLSEIDFIFLKIVGVNQETRWMVLRRKNQRAKIPGKSSFK
jgi:RecB family endonuclease NucS